MKRGEPNKVGTCASVYDECFKVQRSVFLDLLNSTFKQENADELSDKDITNIDLENLDE